MKFDATEIRKMLRHREPFLFIDSIEDISEDTIEASLKILENNFFLKGHFPTDPVMPGVLLIEAMAQAAGFLIAYNLSKENSIKGENGHDFFLAKVNSVKFKDKIVPPSELRIKVKVNPSMIENFCEASGQIYVDGELKALGSLTLYLKMKK
jgi:3-hydroxymyristoyl/3-hydroxydecanoyl-(acyl carrier protein) dehydratase